MEQNNKLKHLDYLAQRLLNEKLLIASGAVFQFINQQIEPISDIAIASELNLSMPLLRQTLKELYKDNLIDSNNQGDWEVGF